MKAKRRKRKISRKAELRCKVALSVAAVAALGIYIFWYTGLTKVNFDKLSVVKVRGYDSNGAATVVLEQEKEIEKHPELKEFFASVEVEVSKAEKLTNGETIEVKYLYDAELAKEKGILVTGDHKTVTVADLPEAERITFEELFRDVEVTWEGISPLIVPVVENKSNHEFLKYVSYEVQGEKEYYKNGEEVVLKAVFDPQDAEDRLYAIDKGEDNYTRVYTAEAEEHYLTDVSRISDEILETLTEEGVKHFQDANQYGLRIFSEANCMPIWEGKKTTFTWENPYFISAYFTTASEEAMGSMETHVNDVKLVYGVTLMQADGVNCDAELVVQFTNLKENADGTIDLALDSAKMISATHKDKFIKELVNNKNNDKYRSERIK